MKYVPSALVGQLSRSLGSTTASRNRFGSYLRNRVTPVNPSTPRQTIVRNRLQTLTELWRLLLADQRNAWTAFGEDIVRQDSLGQTYNLTGLQAYTSVNLNRAAMGLATISDPLPYDDPDVLDSFTLETGTAPAVLRVVFTPTPLLAGQRLIIAATRGVSAGISFLPRGDYRQIVVSNAAAASPINILVPWVARFGVLPQGRRIFVRGVVMNDNGIGSSPFIASQVVPISP